MTVPDTTRFARCRHCKVWYPRTAQYFEKSKRYASGVKTRCKKCKVLRNKNYGEKYGRQWREKNPDYHKEYSAKHKEYFKQKEATWRRNNRARVAANLARYRARKAAAGGSCSPDEITAMYESQEGLCAYCECDLNGIYEVDHMLPISRGGANDWPNLAITCSWCNRSKHNKTTEEFFITLQ